MLSTSPIIPVLLATDLDASREFYEKGLGLEVLEDSDSEVTYASGGGKLRLSASDDGTKDSQTQLDWVVADVRAEVAELRARGIEVEEYDNDEVKTENGVADQGEAWVAWIVDPGGNVLGIEQPKD